MLTHTTAAGFIALNHAMRFQSWQALMKKLLSLCLLPLMATAATACLPSMRPASRGYAIHLSNVSAADRELKDDVLAGELLVH